MEDVEAARIPTNKIKIGEMRFGAVAFIIGCNVTFVDKYHLNEYNLEAVPPASRETVLRSG